MIGEIMLIIRGKNLIGRDDAFVKPHIALDRSIADEVMKDLSQRFGDMGVEENESKSYMFDPGGMCMATDDVFSFPVNSGLIVKCRAQHFDVLYDDIGRYSSKDLRGNDVKYIKVYGHWSCLCISLDDLNDIRSAVDSDDLKEMAKKSVQRFSAKLSHLNDTGVIIKAMKGSDGRYYKVPNDPNNIDPENMN